MNLSETKFILNEASKTWVPYSCPGTAECCQLTTTKRHPHLWPTEWAVLLEFLKKEKREIPPARADGGCAFLDESGKRCTVYEARPFGCRTFFCHRIIGPKNIPVEQTNGLLNRLMAMNVALDDEANPKSILEWLEVASDVNM
jgi:uncharacterized protein